MDTIRRATLGDEVLLADLNSFVHDLHVRARPETFKTTEGRELEEWFRLQLENPKTRIWIAESRDLGHSTGYLLALHMERSQNSFCQEFRWCEIDQVAVHPTARKRGVARALVIAAINDAREAGFQNVELRTWAFNAEAGSAFERLGFVPKIITYELHETR